MMQQGSRIVRNIGMSDAADRPSQQGCNVMPTAESGEVAFVADLGVPRTARAAGRKPH